MAIIISRQLVFCTIGDGTVPQKLQQLRSLIDVDKRHTALSMREATGSLAEKRGIPSGTPRSQCPEAAQAETIGSATPQFAAVRGDSNEPVVSEQPEHEPFQLSRGKARRAQAPPARAAVQCANDFETLSDDCSDDDDDDDGDSSDGQVNECNPQVVNAFGAMQTDGAGLSSPGRSSTKLGGGRRARARLHRQDRRHAREASAELPPSRQDALEYQHAGGESVLEDIPAKADAQDLAVDLFDSKAAAPHEDQAPLDDHAAPDDPLRAELQSCMVSQSRRFTNCWGRPACRSRAAGRT